MLVNKSAAKMDKVVSLTLISCWLFNLTVCPGCKKKEQPEEAQQAIPTESVKRKPVAEGPNRPDKSQVNGLRILYVGHPGSGREKDFVDFLCKHFETVETADLKEFKEEQTDNFDVTMFDYDGDGFKAPRPRLSREFSRPVITVGVAGGLMCLGWNLKTGYL